MDTVDEYKSVRFAKKVLEIKQRMAAPKSVGLRSTFPFLNGLRVSFDMQKSFKVIAMQYKISEKEVAIRFGHYVDLLVFVEAQSELAHHA